MKKLKILPSILMLVLCVGVLAVGVFAVTPTKNKISGTITINAVNPEVYISAYMLDKDDNMEAVPFFTRTSVRSGVTIPLKKNMNFNFEGVNTQADLHKASIKIRIVLENPSLEDNLGAYFTNAVITGAINDSNKDKIKTKMPLVTEAGENDIVKLALSGYSLLEKATSETNLGFCYMDLSFDLIDFVDSPTSVVMSAEKNQIYLNIENYNETYVQKNDAYYEKLNYTVVGKGKTSINSTDYKNAGSPNWVKVADGVTTLQLWTFHNCANIEKLIIPSTVTSMDSKSFSGMTDAPFAIEDGIKYILNENGEKYFLLDASNYTGTSFTVPLSCGYIMGQFNDNVTNLTITKNVKGTSGYLFGIYPNVSTLTIDGCTNSYFTELIFGPLPSVSEVIVTAGTTFIEEVPLPSKVRTGYVAGPWNVQTVGSDTSTEATAITTSHDVDTRYFRTVTPK